MTVAFASVGGSVVGSTSVAPTYPSGIVAGDLLVLAIINKYPSNGPTTPSGWVLASQGSGGAGASGADSGSIYSSVYYRIADGTEAGSLSVTITGGNAAFALILRYTKTETNWDIASTTGASNTPGTAWSATGAVDIGIQAGDLVLFVTAINTDTWAWGGTRVLSAPGVTFGSRTQRADASSTVGDDLRIAVHDYPASAGSSSGPPSLSMTATGSDANSPAGCTVFFRLREVTLSGTAAAAGAASGGAVGKASIAATGAAAGAAAGTLYGIGAVGGTTAASAGATATVTAAVSPAPVAVAWEALDAAGLALASTTPATVTWVALAMDLVSSGVALASTTPVPLAWAASDGVGCVVVSTAPPSVGWEGLDASVSTAALTTPPGFAWTPIDAGGLDLVAVSPAAFAWSALDGGTRIGLDASPCAFAWSAADASCQVSVDGPPAAIGWSPVEVGQSIVAVPVELGWFAVDAVGVHHQSSVAVVLVRSPLVRLPPTRSVLVTGVRLASRLEPYP